MTAARMQASISFLLALLLAMLIAVIEAGPVARADTPQAQSDTLSAASSAVQNDWEQDSESRARTDAAKRADATDNDDRDDDDDDADTNEDQDRRTVEKYFNWDKDWHHSFGRRHLRSGRHTQGDDIVNFGGNSRLPAGGHADSVVSILGSSSNEGDAGDVVSILGNTQSSGHVQDSAVAVLGNVKIDGPVDGDVVAVLGNVNLGPHAQVGGDVTAVGGTVIRDPAATVAGNVENVGGFSPNFDRFRPWIDHCLLYGRPLALVSGIGWAWGLAFILLALYVFIALLFRDAVTRCAVTVETQPGMSLVAALLSILLIPITIVLLCITVIGIAAIPFVLLGAFCMGLFGKAVILAWLGRRVIGHRGQLGGQLAHPAVAVVVGGLIVLVLYLVPVLGFLVYNILGFLGFGAVIYTLILAGRERRAARPSAAPYAGGPPSGSVPPAPSGPVPAAAAAAVAAGATVDATAAAAGERPTTAAAPGVAPSPHFIDPALAATLPRAGFWIRMGALFLDLLLVGILTGMLHHSHNLELVVLAIYGALMWKLRGSTVGGLVFHLQVIRVDGRPIDWETAIVRALSCFLSFVVVGLGFFWIAFDSGKQGWHDKIAGTAVVRVPRAVPLV